MVVAASSLGTPESGKHMQAPQNDERFNCQHDTTRKEFLLQLWGGKDHVSACPETREQQEIKSSRTGRFAHVYPFESRSFWTTPPQHQRWVPILNDRCMQKHTLQVVPRPEAEIRCVLRTPKGVG